MSKVQVSTESLKNLKESLEFDSIHRDEIEIIWIGQAGFVFKFKNRLLLIDPYLSDYLSKKYEQKLFPHIRLMEIPIDPQLITNIDFILCSHAHTDHMDPETITILRENNSGVKIVIPAAKLEEAKNIGVNPHQIILVNDGEIIPLTSEINIIGVASAHETLKVNEKGQHHFLGFVFDFGGVRIYHSGDCVPYEGLTRRLKELEIDVALLPINGRDDYRLKNNIDGNFLIPEVIELCKSAKIDKLIVHHFGMFAYNTVPEEKLDNLRTVSSSQLQIFVPDNNTIYKVKKK